MRTSGISWHISRGIVSMLGVTKVTKCLWLLPLSAISPGISGTDRLILESRPSNWGQLIVATFGTSLAGKSISPPVLTLNLLVKLAAFFTWSCCCCCCMTTTESGCCCDLCWLCCSPSQLLLQHPDQELQHSSLLPKNSWPPFWPVGDTEEGGGGSTGNLPEQVPWPLLCSRKHWLHGVPGLLGTGLALGSWAPLALGVRSPSTLLLKDILLGLSSIRGVFSSFTGSIEASQTTSGFSITTALTLLHFSLEVVTVEELADVACWLEDSEGPRGWAVGWLMVEGPGEGFKPLPDPPVLPPGGAMLFAGIPPGAGTIFRKIQGKNNFVHLA